MWVGGQVRGGPVKEEGELVKREKVKFVRPLRLNARLGPQMKRKVGVVTVARWIIV